MDQWLGYSQYHHAVAGGFMRIMDLGYINAHAPTRYRVVVLTVSKQNS